MMSRGSQVHQSPFNSFVLTYPLGSATVTCKCFRSMRKNESRHSLEVSVCLADKTLSGKCSCVVGISGYCHHVIGFFFLLGSLLVACLAIPSR